jgi:hypothetical protein
VVGVVGAAAGMIDAVPNAASRVGDEPPSESVPCAEPSEPVVRATVAEAEARLVGTWIRCGDAPSLLACQEGDDIGMEFTADGRFFRIYEGADGALFRPAGLVQEGIWTIDLSPAGWTRASG